MKNWFIEQLAMYAAYHRDWRNQATHHIGVPLIVFSLLVIASTQILFIVGDQPVTIATLILGLLLLVYLVNTPLVGMIALIFYGVLLYFADTVAQTGHALTIFLTAFIGGWVIQFIGHSFEGRKPALFDNLLQIFMAPAFLIAEILFAFGLQQSLRREINTRKSRYVMDTGQ